MNRAESIRKQVGDLRPHDLEQFPIWEHAIDEEGEPGQDEETVKPRPDLSVADPSSGLFLVRAEFVANDGTRFDGYVYPSTEHEPGLIQPTIVTKDGQVNFWYGMLSPEPGAIEAHYELLGTSAEQLFPLKYRAKAKYKGAKLQGTVTAFLRRNVGSDAIVEIR